MNRLPKGRLCVLLGHDGAGKSTVLREIQRERPEWLCTSLDPEDFLPIPGIDLRPPPSWHPRETALALQPMSRSAFLLLILSIVTEYNVIPALAAGSTVVVDSYYYRLLAKEAVLNPVGYALIKHASEILPKPNLILEIIVQTDLAYSRKKTLTRLEYAGDSSQTGFARFQETVRKRVQQLCVGVPTREVDGERAVRAIAEDVVDLIESGASATRT